MKKFDGNIIYFFPVVIMLIMGVVAYKAGSDLVDGRKDRSQAYYEYLATLGDLQLSINRLEDDYAVFLSAQDDIEFPELVSRYSQLKQSFSKLHKMIIDRVSNLPEAKRSQIYLQIDTTLKPINKNLNNLSVRLDILLNASNRADENFDIAFQEIQALHTALLGLESKIYKDIEYGFYTFEVSQQESALYWSICLMAVIGMILTLLNADKLSRLRRSEVNKKKRVEQLQSRMAALDMAKDGIIIMNADGSVEYVNDALCQTCGFLPENKTEILGRLWGDIFTEDSTRDLQDNVYPTLMEEGYWSGEFDMHRKDGTVAVTDLSLTKLPDGGVVGTIQDITKRQQAENEKKNLEAQFFQAQKMEAIGRLAGGIAHDFNNILAAMNGYAEFLLDDLDDDSEQHQFANNILLAGLQARSLVDQLLSFSRRDDTDKNTLDIIASVHEAFSMLQATLPKTIEIKHNFTMPNAFIEGNPTQISQLIMNLCVNAVDAMEEEKGSLEISVEGIDVNTLDIQGVVKEHLPDAEEAPLVRIDDLECGASRLLLGHVAASTEYIRLRVKDTGCGMSRVIMEHIFEPFFTTKSVDKGTGLGLATVHGVVVGHHGCMVIESALGQGTQFDLYFPLSKAAQGRRNKLVNKDFTKNDDLERKHILLVEDQDNVRDMIEKMLGRMGYDVSCAESGLEGLDVIRENPETFDLVLTDHNMPKMTGTEMISQIHLDLPDIPFIVLSGYSEDKIQEIIQDHQAVKATIRKPVSKDILASTIRSVLS